jgi:hypothetical protein
MVRSKRRRVRARGTSAAATFENRVAMRPAVLERRRRGLRGTALAGIDDDMTRLRAIDCGSTAAKVRL